MSERLEQSAPPPCVEHDRFAEVVWWRERATDFLFDLIERGGGGVQREPEQPATK